MARGKQLKRIAVTAFVTPAERFFLEALVDPGEFQDINIYSLSGAVQICIRRHPEWEKWKKSPELEKRMEEWKKKVKEKLHADFD